MSNNQYKPVRNLVKNKLCGILSTHSKAMDGYPFGSFVTYCVDTYGNLVLMLSDLAQHTNNIKKNNKVSLTIMDDYNIDDIQNTARVTILGTVTQYEDQDLIADLYNKFFPNAEKYHKTHDFNLYCLNIERIRYIGGFGDINWLNNKPFMPIQQFTPENIASVISHMNDHHQPALKVYTEHLNLQEPVKMIHFDNEGMWLQASQNHYISFPNEVKGMGSLRKILTAMAKQTS
jgi:putative heme iron utilization protein